MSLDTIERTIAAADAWVDAWASARAVSSAPCLHELFERQADLDGGAVAVACADAELTYAELT